MRLLKRNRIGYVAAPLLSLLIGSMAGCGEDKPASAPCSTGGTAGGGTGTGTGGSGGISLTGSTTLFVDVRDAKDNSPIIGAQVGVDSRMRTSDPLGRLLFDNLPPGSKRFIFSAPQHVRMGMMSFFPEAIQDDPPSWNANMLVSWKKRSAEIVCPKAEEECVANADDVHLVIPAKALRNPNKEVVSGEVKLFLTRFDPEAELSYLPGSIETRDESTGAILPLRVSTMAVLEVFQGDTPLSLIDGKAAQVEILAPNPSPDQIAGAKGFAMDADAPAWKAAGTGSLAFAQSGKPTWSAEIKSLGFYAAAVPAVATMKLRIEVKHSTGEAFTGAYAQATSKAYRSHATGFTNRNGVLELVVPRDEQVVPAIDLRLPAVSTDQQPKFTWETYANGARRVVVQLEAPVEGAESCAVAGASRQCEDQGKAISCYTKYQFCNGLVWGACSSFGEQPVELCNGIDDDCDGKIDGPEAELGVLCDSGRLGICAIGKVVECNAGGVVKCEPNTTASDETCDGLDNDCDGMVDDGVPEVGQPCTPQGGVGQGICAMTTQVCVNGVLVCKPEGAPEEVCNGQDDDCNGVPDDLGQVVCGVGACQVTVPFCEKDSCTPLAPKALEICGNGIDDNCDGKADNNCCDPTQTSCPTAPEICDGEDNDRDGKTDAADDVLYEDDGTTVKTYHCCKTNGGVEKLGDNLDNDCDGAVDADIFACAGITEVQNGKDDDCDGYIDETPTCDAKILEKCDTVDGNCNGVIDEGLCCGVAFNNGVTCLGWILGDVPLVKDSLIGTSIHGNVQISANVYGNAMFNAARYVLPMKKKPAGANVKNRFYWEVAITPASMSTNWCIGVGTEGSPMTISDANAIENCVYLPNFTPLNQEWTGAIVSVLLDLPEGKVSYWVNGALTLEQPIDPEKTYYPMSWLYSAQGDTLTHNFGPTFTYPISNLYEAPKPAP